MLRRSLCGEMTVQIKTDTDQGGVEPSSELEMITAVARAMNLSSKMEITELKEVLFPCLICSAVYKNNFEIIDACFKEGANISAGDYDMRTPLHIATSEGNLEMTQYLLERGALVHMKDRNSDTPLVCAVLSGNVALVQLLVSVGAHLTLSRTMMGERLCQAAKDADLQRVLCWLEAGVDINQADPSGRTCVEAAAAAGHHDMVSALVKRGANK